MPNQSEAIIAERSRGRDQDLPVCQVGALATAKQSEYPYDDIIAVRSRTRPDGYHLISINVLAGCTVACTCEAGRKGEICWARREVDANEGSWGFARCTSCGSLLRLGLYEAGSGPVRQWQCPTSRDHSGHEPAAAVLFRVAAGRPVST